MGILLKSPAARYVAHIIIAFLAAFVPLWTAAGQPIDKAALIGLVVAAARAVIGALTSTNPKIGANII